MKNKRSHLKIEHVYSEIKDNRIADHLNDSEIWQKCYHKSDKPDNFNGYEYKIAFDGLVPIQVMSIKEVA